LGLAKWDIPIDMTAGKIKFYNFFEEGEREAIKNILDRTSFGFCKILRHTIL
jgi:hypothetical protein